MNLDVMAPNVPALPAYRLTSASILQLSDEWVTCYGLEVSPPACRNDFIEANANGSMK